MDPKKPEKALNDDAITEILLRLPAKVVCRSRCVSKLLLSHISSPQFLRAHAATAYAEISGFYLYEQFQRQAEFCPLNGGGWGCPDPTLSFLDYEGIPPEPVDSCNGLLLCRPHQTFESKPFVLSLCNPTTKDHEVIPLHNYTGREIGSASLRLAFDPRMSPHYMIFRRDHKLMYKYTSETRSWKLLEAGMMSNRPMPWPPSVYWKGSLVWSDNLKTLAALDVESEQIQALSLPPPRKMTKFLHLTASRDRLHCIRGENYFRFEILEMASVSSGWQDLYSIQLNCDQYSPIHPLFILEFIRGDEDQLLLQMQGNIVSCHLKQKTFTTVCQVQPGMSSPQAQVGMHRYKIFPLAPSLFPIGIDVPPSEEWVSWKSKHDQLLISLMVDQPRNGKKSCELARMFNQATGLNYDVRHVENRLKSYQREYQTVKRILAIGGFHWAPSDKVVNASYEDWQTLFMINPNALAFKRNQVPFEDLKIMWLKTRHSELVTLWERKA